MADEMVAENVGADDAAIAETRLPPPSDLLNGEWKVTNAEEATKVAKKYVKLLKPFYWHTFNVTRERDYIIKWLGEQGSGYIDEDHFINVPLFFERIIAERFSEGVEDIGKRLNWKASDSARLAHVMVDDACRDALNILFAGGSRLEIDAG
jgi:hypothetical protein